MEKWNRLQTLAHDKDERLKENRKQWKHFKRQLEDLEQASQQFTNMDTLCKLNKHIFLIRIFCLVPRTVYTKADVHRDQVQRLGLRLKKIIFFLFGLNIFQMNYKHCLNQLLIQLINLVIVQVNGFLLNIVFKQLKKNLIFYLLKQIVNIEK